MGTRLLPWLVQRRVNRVHGQGLLVCEGAKSNEGNSAQPLARIALEALIDRRQQQREDRLRAGANWKGTADGYVFTTRIGTLIEPRNVNRAFTAALRRAGLEHRRRTASGMTSPVCCSAAV
jgi:hypothetical protein